MRRSSRFRGGGVSAVVKLLAEGATVPFIARYRKEATGGLDEVQIRAIEERRAYLIELEERRGTVLVLRADHATKTSSSRWKLGVWTRTSVACREVWFA